MSATNETQRSKNLVRWLIVAILLGTLILLARHAQGG
jgi:hypothetical protein